MCPQGRGAAAPLVGTKGVTRSEFHCSRHPFSARASTLKLKGDLRIERGKAEKSSMMIIIRRKRGEEEMTDSSRAQSCLGLKRRREFV